MISFVKSGVELAFETMVKNGIIDESAYYESLHELPLIANLVARKKLYEMNRIISDTAEYGCYLFNNDCHHMALKKRFRAPKTPYRPRASSTASVLTVHCAEKTPSRHAPKITVLKPRRARLNARR